MCLRWSICASSPLMSARAGPAASRQATLSRCVREPEDGLGVRLIGRAQFAQAELDRRIKSSGSSSASTATDSESSRLRGAAAQPVRLPPPCDPTSAIERG